MQTIYIRILLVLSIILTGQILKAQSNYKSGIGIKIGVNFSRLTGDELTNKFGGFGGLIFTGDGPGIVRWHGEINYSVQGTTLSRERNQDIEFIMKFLNFNFLTRFYLARGFSVGLGPQLGILLSARQNRGFDATDVFKTESFGILTDAAYETPEGYQIFLRYNYGINDLGDGFRNRNESYKLRLIQFGFGYVF